MALVHTLLISGEMQANMLPLPYTQQMMLSPVKLALTPLALNLLTLVTDSA